MKNYLDYIKENEQKFLSQWFEILRIPSVSALKEHKPDMQKAVEWISNFLSSELKMSSRIIATSGNSLVYGETEALPGKPTVLIYGHYDVQPTDPESEWKTSPFEPTIKDGKVFCRGANDDKGQWMALLTGLQTYLRLNSAFPIQVKVILEGEEEVGSLGISNFLQTEEGKKLLACDAILVSDTSAAGPGMAAITYGLRGVMGFELKLTGPNKDLHSGIYGGSVTNPANALCSVLSKVLSPKGVIQIPGFYDDVLPISDVEREALASTPFDEEENKTQLGINEEFGEEGYTTLERRGARPSFDINGMTSGYQGEGGKTIIPSWASAKFTFRTVPNMNPEIISQRVRDFIQELLPPGITMELTYQQGSGGMLVPLTGQFISAASKALERQYGRKPIFVRDGGSIPIVAELRNTLNAEAILVGFGLDDDGIHSPNEKFNLDSFFGGVYTSVLLLEEFSQI